MSARVLVVDDVDVNRVLLKAKLEAAYYTVFTAASGAEAIEVAAAEQPDLVLLDVMMPGMNGFDCCKRLKSNPATAHVPVVMVTTLDGPENRVLGLEAGADDFLTKPANDLALYARVRSLVRVKMMIDELRLRESTFREFGVENEALHFSEAPPGGRVIIVESRPARGQQMVRVLRENLPIEVELVDNAVAARALAANGGDLCIIDSQLREPTGLRICSMLRSDPSTRQLAALMTVEHDDFETISKALELGASDYIMRPLDPGELVARVRSQLVRKHYTDQLRETVHAGVRLAMIDSLTGLHNRRYADQHMARMAQHAVETGASLSALLLDLDHFKSVNDVYGHAAGDRVLIEFAERLQYVVRGVDLVARQGGEEFLAVLPETNAAAALTVAERIRTLIASTPFRIADADDQRIPVTVSIGIAEWRGEADSCAQMVARADAALYASKRCGRNRVTVATDMMAASTQVA